MKHTDTFLFHKYKNVRGPCLQHKSYDLGQDLIPPPRHFLGISNKTINFIYSEDILASWLPVIPPLWFIGSVKCPWGTTLQCQLGSSSTLWRQLQPTEMMRIALANAMKDGSLFRKSRPVLCCVLIPFWRLFFYLILMFFFLNLYLKCLLINSHSASCRLTLKFFSRLKLRIWLYLFHGP